MRKFALATKLNMCIIIIIIVVVLFQLMISLIKLFFNNNSYYNCNNGLCPKHEWYRMQLIDCQNMSFN